MSHSQLLLQRFIEAYKGKIYRKVQDTNKTKNLSQEFLRRDEIGIAKLNINLKPLSPILLQ